mgnify:CR=1 FL=1
MKHPKNISLITILFFLLSQLFGMFLLLNSFDVKVIEGKTMPVYKETAIGERPRITGFQTIGYIVVAILLGTSVLLVIIRYSLSLLWKLMYITAIFFSSLISLNSILPLLFSIFIAIIFCIFKYKKGYHILNNFIDMFVFSGIAIIFAPLMDSLHALLLLFLISFYDIIAVNKTKHMVKLAEFQLSSGMFAGLKLPYRSIKGKGKIELKNKGKVSSAIIGGGDVVFPLIFTATIMNKLILSGMNKSLAFIFSLPVPVLNSLMLSLLLYISKKNRYYPAMPFLATACLLSYLIIHILLLLF